MTNIAAVSARYTVFIHTIIRIGLLRYPIAIELCIIEACKQMRLCQYVRQYVCTLS